VITQRFRLSAVFWFGLWCVTPVSADIGLIVPKSLSDLPLRPAMVVDLSPEERRLIEEYRTQYVRLVEFYRNIRIIARWKEFTTSKAHDSEAPFGYTQVTYRSNGGDFLRLDSEALTSDGDATGRVRVLLVRPEGYLTAIKDPGDSSFAIDQLAPSREEGETSMSSAIFQWAPHSVRVRPVHWYFFSDWVHERFVGFRFTQVTVERQDKRELVWIHVAGRSKTEESEWVGKFSFDRSNGWVLTGYEWGYCPEKEAHRGFVNHAEFEYSGELDGVALLSLARYWSVSLWQKKEGLEHEFDIVEIVPGPVPLEEFSPEALGIRHLGRHRSNWTWTVLGLLVGGALIIVYLILRRRESLARKDRATKVLIFCVLGFSTGNLSSWAADMVPKRLDDLTIRASMVEGLSQEERKLVEEYRRQYLQIVDLYRNVKIVAKRMEHRRIRGKKHQEPSTSVRHSLLTYRSNGGQYLRMDDKALTSEGVPAGPTTVTIVRPEGYLRAKKDNEGSAFTVFDLMPCFDEGEDVMSGWLFQWAPHTVYAHPAHWYFFTDWLYETADDFRIKRVMLEQRNGAEVVTFHTSGKSKQNGRDVTGLFTFDRSKGWVMTDFRWGWAELNAERDSSRHGSFEYVGSYDGIGLLSRAEYWHEIGPQQRMGAQRRFDVVEIVPGPVPLEEFSPEALGIRDLGLQRSNWTWTVLGLLVGGALIIVYLILRRRESLARKGP
jgi:hypothetical protein